MKQQTLNQYLQNKYGKKIYKVALNAGFSCPNRDGTTGERGCIFCSGTGSGDFAEDPQLSITEQIDRGKKRIESKLPKKTDAGNDNPEKNAEYGLIAYFQAFTNTYAPVERLREVYMEAVRHPEVDIISIATRPDCLGDDVLDLLSEINEIKPVWVELGLQTMHESTAKYIRRGYPLSTYDEAVRKLRGCGLETIVHVIFGLPGETKEDMLDTIRYVGKSHVQGIKIQLLHVLRGTDLADDYLNGSFECLTMDEYIDLVADALEILPDDIVIHRMTGDGDKKILIAPEWSRDKKTVLNALNKQIRTV